MKTAERRHALTAGFPRALTAAAVGDCLTPKVSNERFTDVIISDPESGGFKLRAYTFEVVEGPDRGRSLKSDRGTIVVGSAPAADLVLTDDRGQIEDARLHEGKFTGVTRIDAELGELLGTGKGRRTSDDQRVMVFNLGIALEDLATGVEILERARERKVGTLLRA